MTMDVTKAIEPKSDQLNADDLMTGPRTIKIRDVKVSPGKEQPVWIYYEGDNNKPWKPSKSGSRCLAMCWGADASRWIGLSCTIYRDPDILWGGAKVGGIMPSHVEGISGPQTVMLTKTRTSRKPTVIKPLEVTAPEKPTTKTKTTPQSPSVDPVEMQRQMDAVSGDAVKKREWWSGLTDDEKAVVKGLAASDPQ